MTWKMLVLAAGALLAVSAAIGVFASPDDTPTDDPTTVTEEPDDGTPDDGIDDGDPDDGTDDGDPDDGDLEGDPDDVGTLQDDDGDEQGVEAIAQVIADAFSTNEQEVLAFHEQDIGFGALFKLYALASAMGMNVDDLLETLTTDGDGGYMFGFGELRNALTEEQLDALQSGPKNLGQLVSASHRPEGAGPGAAEEAAAEGLARAQEHFSAHESNGHGPPDNVPRGGPHADGD